MQNLRRNWEGGLYRLDTWLAGGSRQIGRLEMCAASGRCQRVQSFNAEAPSRLLLRGKEGEGKRREGNPSRLSHRLNLSQICKSQQG